MNVQLGQEVKTKQLLGYISDAFGDEQFPIRARRNGIVISCTQNPLVNQGDGILHLAHLPN